MSKTAEEILKNQTHGFDRGQWGAAINAMKEYAEVQVKKHLELAYENAEIRSDFYNGRPINFIVKSSITSTPINLD